MTEHTSFACLPAGGNSDGKFGLSLDGELRLHRDLDREETPVYSIIIKASSNKSWTPPRAQRAARTKALDPARDPSLLEVRVELEDINDQTPRFTKAEYTAGNLHCSVSVLLCREPSSHLFVFFRSCIKCQSGLRADQSPGYR